MIQNNVVNTKTIEWNELKTYEFNSLKSSDNRDISKLKNAIINSGFNFPFYVWHGHRYVIDGKGRDIALHELEKEGYEIPPLPIIEIKAESKSMAKRLVLQASSNHGQVTPESFEEFTLDLELEPLDFEMFDLGLGELELAMNNDDDIGESHEGLADEDAVPEEPVEPRTKLGDVWLCGNHRVHCGDSTSIDAVNKLMGGGKADMVFTDPPYNVKISGLGSGSTSKNGKTVKATTGIGQIHGEFKMASGEMTKQGFTDFLRSCFTCLVAASKDGSIHYICMDWRHMQELLSAGEIYTELKNLCVWNKDNGGMGTLYRSKHELVFVYKNGKEKHINNFMLGETGRYRTNVWDYPIVNSFANQKREGNVCTGTEETKMHPTVKPLALVEDAILDCSNSGEIILDLFGGSGTTMIAAEKSGRVARLMELDEKYVDVIVTRWQQFTGKKATLESTGEFFSE